MLDDWREGLRLLEERVAGLPARLREALSGLGAAGAGLELDARGARSVVATGVGSSAAQARFLASVLAELGVAARFVPLGAFLAAPPAGAAEAILVVFSQGLSPNARLALSRPEAWRSVCLVTATPDLLERPAGDGGGGETLREGDAYRGPARQGAPPVPLARQAPPFDLAERREALAALRASGVAVVRHPGAEEFGTLLRVAGPMTAYAAALRVAGEIARVAGAVAAPAWLAADLDGICARVADARARVDREHPDLGAGALEANLALLASGTHVERIENLRCKIVEGMLRPMPPAFDLLDLAHGPFQQTYAGCATLLALARADAPGEGELLERIASMLDAGRHRLVRLVSDLPGPLAIFEHEALMNAVVLRYVAERRVDQVDWPGRGADAALYAFGGSALPPLVVAAAEAAAAAVAPEPGRQLDDLTWPEVASLLATGHRTAVLPLGSTEQHGPHLPVATDTRIAAELARRLCARLPGAIGLPVLALGCASEHLSFAGTLSLGETTLAAVLCDLAGSLERHGFERLFVFSAHGGNRAALERALPAMRAAAPSLAIAAHTALTSLTQVLHRESARHGVPPAAAGHHAGEFETSVMAMLAPSSVRRERLAPGLLDEARDPDAIFYPDLRANAPEGTVGDPSRAAAARGDRYLDAWVEALLDAYRSPVSWDQTNGR